MDILLVLSVVTLVALLAWWVQGFLVSAYRRYHSAFHKEAKARLSEFFLFVDPAQLWLVNLTVCAILMLVIYWLSAMAWLAAAAGGVSLIAPQCMIAHLRRVRLARFDQQLPDLLLSLAGALRAGSGVQSALRHIVTQAPSPL